MGEDGLIHYILNHNAAHWVERNLLSIILSRLFPISVKSGLWSACYAVLILWIVRGKVYDESNDESITNSHGNGEN